MTRPWIFLLAVAPFAYPAIAQRANLAGTWKLNRTASYFGSEHPSADYYFTKSIVMKENVVSMTDLQTHREMMNIALPDARITTDFICDGKDHPGTVSGSFPRYRPIPVTVLAEWQSGTLAIQQAGQSSSGAITFHIRYYLSEEGNQLIELVESHKLFGDLEQRLVFDRVR